MFLIGSAVGVPGSRYPCDHSVPAPSIVPQSMVERPHDSHERQHGLHFGPPGPHLIACSQRLSGTAPAPSILSGGIPAGDPAVRAARPGLGPGRVNSGPSGTTVRRLRPGIHASPGKPTASAAFLPPRQEGGVVSCIRMERSWPTWREGKTVAPSIALALSPRRTTPARYCCHSWSNFSIR